jgi:hypothetical protein
MTPPSGRPDNSFSLSAEDRSRLRADIDADAFEKFLAMLPAQARPLMLRLAAKDPDLLAIWDAAPALRDSDRSTIEADGKYHNPHLQMHVVPKLEDVTLSDPVLQEMLRGVFLENRRKDDPKGEQG